MRKKSSRGVVAVIIVSYNTRDLLRGCLASLKGPGRKRPPHVVVVDNASSDGSVEMVRKEFSWVELIANDRNAGFAAANNQALRCTPEEFILCLNPDTIVEENTIRNSVDYLRANPDVGLLGCRINNPDGTLQLSARRFPSLWTLIVEMTGLYKVAPSGWTIFNPWIVRTNGPVDTDVVKGAFFLLRKKALEVVGTFDERFALYSEEADWCRRARTAGWRVVYFPQVQITHLEGASSVVRRNSAKFLLLESEAAYFRKHHGNLMAILVLLLWWTGALLRVIGWLGVWAFRRIQGRTTAHSLERLRFYGLMVEWITLRPFREPSRLP